ncbi:MAG: ATPase [Nitrospinae bacterium CG11_big_fil_rev_8_21_14_0_20_45_15]|nr:MAG: ATPase [Nitrospinae bacterium CG11_big_fil_rev_8_21_14_0_20_45_15]
MNDDQNRIANLQKNIERVIYGKSDVIQSAIIVLLAKGHLLIEDVPGVGKTTLAQTLARSIDLDFKRIQFTNDLLPADITGVSIYDRDTKNFHFKKGPLFSNIVLADEINRATPRTQSALLEAMSERQVSVDNHSHPLEEPFMVIATQNPVESHGAHPLPESQMDRFMMCVSMGYPAPEDERRMLSAQQGNHSQSVASVLTTEELLQLQNNVEQVAMDNSLTDYVLNIVSATRNHKHLQLGVSPRGGLILQQAARARALIEGRNYCIPDDIKALTLPVFKHRVIPFSRIGAQENNNQETTAILMDILDTIKVPL